MIPTRDRPYDLDNCLAALAECAQELATGPENASLHEVLVVDDASARPASTDGRHGLPVIVLRNVHRLGAGRSRGRGADTATGDILAFLDDDALPRGDWLTVIAGLGSRRRAVTGRVLPFDQGLLSEARQARYDARYAALSPGAPVFFFAGGNSAIVTDLFREVGGFARSGAGGDNSLAETLAERGDPVLFEPNLVIAHRNGKGALKAASEALRAGYHHPDRMSLPAALAAVRSSAIGASWPVRWTNQTLGALHAVGRAAPRLRSAAVAR